MNAFTLGEVRLLGANRELAELKGAAKFSPTATKVVDHILLGPARIVVRAVAFFDQLASILWRDSVVETKKIESIDW